MNTIEKELAIPGFANAAYGPWTYALRAVEIREGQPGWRVQSESPNYKYGAVTVMTYRDYESALKKFNEFRAEIEEAAATEETERKRLCSYCKKELGADAAFPEVLPHRAYDIGYCGCGGWD